MPNRQDSIERVFVASCSTERRYYDAKDRTEALRRAMEKEKRNDLRASGGRISMT